MGISNEELLSWAETERIGLGRTIQYADPAKWEDASPCAGWSNWDVLSHLAGQDVAAAALIVGEDPVELDAYSAEIAPEPLGVDTFNAMTTGARFHQTVLATISEWGHAADQLLAAAGKFDSDDDWAATVKWFGRTVPKSDLLQERAAEWWLHGEDIRAGVDLPPRAEHWSMWMLNDLAIRTIPQTLAETGQEYWGMSVRVTLTSTGGGVWNQRLSAGPEPDPSKRPDVSIEANGHAFALMAGRRFSADAFLENGELKLGGNEEIGYSILEHIRPFP